MSELKEYIDRKLMLGKLDSALLFFSSSLSLAFGLGYAYLETKWLQYYVPMLFLGWFMPVYIGYVRGSLIQDLVEERIRGWIYFIVGLGMYIFSPILEDLVIEISKIGFPTSFVVAIIPSFIVGGLLLGILPWTVIHNIFNIQRKDLKKEVKQAVSYTRYSAFYMANILSIISFTHWSKFFTRPDLLSIVFDTFVILMLSILIVLAITMERKARKLLRNIRT